MGTEEGAPMVPHSILRPPAAAWESASHLSFFCLPLYPFEIQCLDGRMDSWTDRWIDRQTYRMTDRWTNIDRQIVYPSVRLSAFCENLFPICRSFSLYFSVSGRTDGWTNGRMDERKDGRTHGQTDRQMDGQTDRQTQTCRQSVICQFNHTSIREKEVHFQSVKEEADSRSGVVRPQDVKW
jgi:hypothetical protein